jgi:hypothetical protein
MNEKLLFVGLACQCLSTATDCFKKNLENPMDDYFSLLIKTFFGLIYDYNDIIKHRELLEFNKKKEAILGNLSYMFNPYIAIRLDNLTKFIRKLGKNEIITVVDITFDFRRDWLINKLTHLNRL